MMRLFNENHKFVILVCFKNKEKVTTESECTTSHINLSFEYVNVEHNHQSSDMVYA